MLCSLTKTHFGDTIKLYHMISMPPTLGRQNKCMGKKEILNADKHTNGSQKLRFNYKRITVNVYPLRKAPEVT